MNWKDIIGQEKAKDRFNFHFAAYQAGEALPSFMLCGPKGVGKTCIGSAFALRVKEESNGTKKAFTRNCASIKNLKTFWNEMVMPCINDRDVTILFDEASELPMDVTMALLTIVNPNDTNRTSYTYEDMTVDFDLRRQTFMFATTEPHKVFHALMNRCRRIDLEDYSHEDLSAILRRNTKGVTFAPAALEQMAPTLRGNARQAVMMAQDVKTYLAPTGRTYFGLEAWQDMSARLDILPLGLSRLELRVLRILAERMNCSLTRIAATMGMTPAAVQKDLELYLQRCGLLEVTPNGRNLSPLGQAYLKALDGK